MRNLAFAAALLCAFAAQATVTGNPPPTSYTCNGTTTAYVASFPYLDRSQLVVTVTTSGVTSTLALTTDYTVSPSLAPSTGTVTLVAGSRCPNGSTLTVNRVVPLTQPTPFRTGSYQGPVHEQTFDRLEMQMQQGVQKNAAASLASLTLTTPLPVASGGTGGSPPNCGAGVLTSNGTSFSCVTLSGLAPPGTTGILLQSASPGSFQIGHENLRGNMILRQAFGGGGDNNPPNAFWNSALLGDGSNQVNALGGWFYTGGNIGGGFGPLGGGFGGGLRFAPAGFNSGNVGSGSVYAFAGSKGTTNMIEINGWGAATGGSALGTNMAFSGCQYQWPCIQTMTSNGTGSALYLAGQSGINSANNAVYVDTSVNRLVAGPIFGVRNNNANVFTVDITGVIAGAGLTSTGPVSATTLTSSGLATLASATVTGVSTHTGATALNGGTTIGASGTAISGSFRGTTTWNPGTLAACGAGPCATATTSITVTGAATGADCVAGVTSPAPLSGFPVQCIVTATNTCGVMIVNQSNVSQTFGSATFYCRVFNP